MNEGDDIIKALASLVPANHLNVSLDASQTTKKTFRVLFEKKKLPENGWSDVMIEQIVQFLSSLDSNNFPNKCGVGEREARIACKLVAQRHFGFGHGIGRSGDLEESQPKAVGSTIMSRLTNALLRDLYNTMSSQRFDKVLLVPMATGMTLALCLSAIKRERPNASYVLWSRVDQKSCFKSMLVANLIPVIIDTIPTENGLLTNVPEFRQKIEEFGAENIVAIFSTTSCFAPRNCDDISALSLLAHENNIPHLVNNAYGLQSKRIMKKIGFVYGNNNNNSRLDLIVQSTDKNLMVPVGGAIVAGKEEWIEKVAKQYAGRASSSQTLDVFMTLLSLGKNGYLDLVESRKSIFQYMKETLTSWDRYGISVIATKENPISIALELNLEGVRTNVGAMLFKRGVSGARVVANEIKSIDGYRFNGWGAHSSTAYAEKTYLTVAAGIGAEERDVNIFIRKLESVLEKIKSNEKV
ncbi:O-phosphoseryl-tRNA(Sec) selenium transferase [Pseudolycoriella hygida]|uniref:O-phosphoseryl-tRNA(Sec) selenium transferase n=1 Tax=Pseudolycoriella hygida TaxID=35572 RepID=A0A9Q0MN87_9DIPT|nr:O-phosphoseryl-tRNA(Sec) selenium transferase [Pseudolycoriella hygida]